jgi:hypothetical protein
MIELLLDNRQDLEIALFSLCIHPTKDIYEFGWGILVLFSHLGHKPLAFPQSTGTNLIPYRSNGHQFAIMTFSMTTSLDNICHIPHARRQKQMIMTANGEEKRKTGNAM